jgi:type IV secretion system protein VirD4
MNKPADDNSQELAIVAVCLIGVLAVGLYMAVAVPTLVWSGLHGEPTLVSLGDAVGGGVRWIAAGAHGDPRRLPAFGAYRDVMPSPRTWTAINVALLLMLVLAIVAALVRADRWRGTRPVGLPRWHPRSWVTSRSWARPRDLRHLRRRRRRSNGDSAADADGWPLGKLRGRALRSGPESHLMAVAPTRSGKTTRVVVPSLLEHRGPAVVLLNKTDVVWQTVVGRAGRGPVWIYAPLTDELSKRCGWTPLLGCEDWERALRMGRWLFDADPTASQAAHDSGGARFYNREAVGVALPPLLHAAALGGLDMSAVHGWLRSGIDGLDEPRSLLADHDARAAADSIAGIQALDERPRSLMLMSAAQLVDAYRFPSVNAFDRPDFRPEQLLDGGTLYVVVPESEQDVLAPIVGGLLGSVLRTWEERAAATPHNSGAPLRILADEAAHLAPLAKLPTYLAVSAGWGVRWCLVYQSLAQLEHRYGREADTLLGNSLCKLFLGPIQDESTRRYLSELLDEETVTAASWSASPLGHVAPATRHERQAAKVSAQPLMQLREGQALLVHGRDLPAVTYLPAFWERRR